MIGIVHLNLCCVWGLLADEVLIRPDHGLRFSIVLIAILWSVVSECLGCMNSVRAEKMKNCATLRQKLKVFKFLGDDSQMIGF